jgi:hypothetical protein
MVYEKTVPADKRLKRQTVRRTGVKMNAPLHPSGGIKEMITLSSLVLYNIDTEDSSGHYWSLLDMTMT